MGGRAARMAFDNQGQHDRHWSMIISILATIGCAPQTLNEWIGKAEVDRGEPAGVTTGMAVRLTALERENREIKQVNKILRKAPAGASLREAP